MENNKSNKILYIIITILGALLIVVSSILLLTLNKHKDKTEEPASEKEEIKKETSLSEEELKDLAEGLYDKYIVYGNNATIHYAANINDSTKDKYIVELAVNNIIEENNYIVPELSVEEYDEFYISIEGEFLRIKLEDVQEEIQRLFPNTVEVKFEDITDENGYNSINTLTYTIQFNGDYVEIFYAINMTVKNYQQFSKLNSYEVLEDNIVLETLYFGYENSMGGAHLFEDSSMKKVMYTCVEEKDNASQTALCNEKMLIRYDEDTTNFEQISEYILNEMPEYTVRYKHTFTKDEEGNYYWTSTEKVK